MRYYILYTLTAFFLLQCQSSKNTTINSESWIIGHRGAPAFASENTIGSFEKAIELGAEGFELDIVLTRDSQLLVCHDYDLERLCGKKQLTKILGDQEVWRVDQFDLDQLLQLHSIPEGQDLVFREDNIFVSYDTVLSFYSKNMSKGNPNLILYTEIKAPSNEFSDQARLHIADMIYKGFEKYDLINLSSQLWLQSFDEEMMKIIGSDRRFDSFQKTQLGFGKNHSIQSFSSKDDLYQRINEITQNHDVQNIHLSKQEILYLENVKDWDLMDYCNSQNIAVDAYTFRDNRYQSDYENDKGISFPHFESKYEEIKFFSDLGIRALMCDNPGTAIEALK